MIFGTTTLSHWDRNFVPNDNNFVPNHNWSRTQLLSHIAPSHLDLRRRETQLLSQLGHSSWPADRFGTKLLAHSHRYTSLIYFRRRAAFTGAGEWVSSRAFFAWLLVRFFVGEVVTPAGLSGFPQVNSQFGELGKFDRRAAIGTPV